LTNKAKYEKIIPVVNTGHATNKELNMENQIVQLRATISFPSLVDEITYRGAPTGKYGVQLTNLSDRALERLEELGVETKQKPDDKYARGKFIECKSQYPIDNSGKFNILFEDDGKTPFEGSPREIGYGSVVRAKIKAYKGRDGVCRPSLVSMAIEELAKPEVSVDEDATAEVL
jgi:hypothetical protein